MVAVVTSLPLKGLAQLSGGASDTALPDGSGAMLLVSGILLLVALALIGRIVARRRHTRALARTARSQSQAMRDFLSSVRSSETSAVLGIWEYECDTGVQTWSEGLKRLLGIDPSAEFVSGDKESKLYAYGRDLLGKISDHSERLEAYELEVAFETADQGDRTLWFHAFNFRSSDGRVQRVVAVVNETEAQA